jgi:hypothetical protein
MFESVPKRSSCVYKKQHPYKDQVMPPHSKGTLKYVSVLMNQRTKQRSNDLQLLRNLVVLFLAGNFPGSI